MTATLPKTPPMVKGMPVVGNLMELTSTPKMRPFLTRAYLEHGPVFQLSALGRKILVLAGPEGNQFVTKEGHKVLRSREAWRPNDLEMGVQRSMISLDGQMHRAYRRIEAPSYSKSNLAANMRTALKVIAEDLTPFKAGDDLNVPHWCKYVITEQLARVVVNGTARPHMKDMLHFLQTAMMVTISNQRPAALLKLPAYQKSKARVLGMVEDLIQWHRDHTPEQTGRTPDLIDVVLESAKTQPELWNPEDIRMAALGSFIAGMDTAANSLAFLLYRMHHHPEHLPALRAEADDFFENGPITLERLGQCHHLHHTVMETLRLHPIAPVMFRTVDQDTTFQGYELKKDTPVLIGTTVSHGLEKFYRDPETFDPSRFAAPRSEHRQPGAYAPFGVGTHVCAGSGMAEGLIMLSAAALLRTLDLTLPSTYTLKETARPTPSPDDKLVLNVNKVRHDSVSLLTN